MMAMKKDAEKKGKILIISKRQHGKSNLIRDKARKALTPGKRQSKNDAVYYEYRKNRTNKPGFLTGINESSVHEHFENAIFYGDSVTTALMKYEFFLNRLLLDDAIKLKKAQTREILSTKKLITAAYKKIYWLRKEFDTFEK